MEKGDLKIHLLVLRWFPITHVNADAMNASEVGLVEMFIWSCSAYNAAYFKNWH